ncbi:HCP-like protein [Daedalea quercina L-15889]|uniref:HCP-like protein n=1 Tax=Daedalea quercina L-15889 TaxID=1314783 RepID=A0A165LNB7_9APHY|nr:HCP-like protein [Daedalea quercina L-15889]
MTDLHLQMARTLDEQLTQVPPPANGPYQRGRSPAPYNPAPGFVMPAQPISRSHSRGPSSHQPPHAEWSAWAPQNAPPMPQSYQNGHYNLEVLPAQFANMSFQEPPPTQAYHQPRSASVYSTYGPPVPAPQPPLNTSAPASLTAPLPTIPALIAQLPSIEQPAFDPAAKVAWGRDVLSLVTRAQQLTNPDYTAAGGDPPQGPAQIDDLELQRLVDVAVPLIVQMANNNVTPKPVWIAEALYLLATLESSGAFPQYVAQDPRTSFRHCEQAAKAGFHAAWFRLGRDYENFKDVEHARQCFERGVKRGVESCIYRMGMANLMGQLGLPPNPEAALPLLHRAATLASVDVPQPAYVYGLLLLNEFSHVEIPPHFFTPFIPPGSNAGIEARKHLERAAFLNFAPAQYKLGHAYEFAQPPFPFDALLSVQYYSLASQQGEVEADMALSKWFLCGAEGAFERDEGLAWTFAEKAARKGLPSAEFAMGYYAEVGVGSPKDLEVARKWYGRAAQHGNPDAAERLRALSQPDARRISREQHESLADTTIVRKRTLARQRSTARHGPAGARPPASPTQGAQIIHNVRQSSLRHGAPPNGAAMPPSASAPQVAGYGAPAQLAPSASQPRMSPASSPAPGAQRAFANAPRYSLVDPGSRSASPAAPGANRAGIGAGGLPSRPAPQRQNSGQPEVSSPLAQAPPKPGPQTFEEMGITTGKLEDKDCIIM